MVSAICPGGQPNILVAFAYAIPIINFFRFLYGQIGIANGLPKVPSMEFGGNPIEGVDVSSVGNFPTELTLQAVDRFWEILRNSNDRPTENQTQKQPKLDPYNFHSQNDYAYSKGINSHSQNKEALEAQFRYLNSHQIPDYEVLT
jgi:hypothetical protein